MAFVLDKVKKERAKESKTYHPSPCLVKIRTSNYKRFFYLIKQLKSSVSEIQQKINFECPLNATEMKQLRVPF